MKPYTRRSFTRRGGLLRGRTRRIVVEEQRASLASVDRLAWENRATLTVHGLFAFEKGGDGGLVRQYLPQGVVLPNPLLKEQLDEQLDVPVPTVKPGIYPGGQCCPDLHTIIGHGAVGERAGRRSVGSGGGRAWG
jgi:hypothetical protein